MYLYLCFLLLVGRSRDLVRIQFRFWQECFRTIVFVLEAATIWLPLFFEESKINDEISNRA